VGFAKKMAVKRMLRPRGKPFRTGDGRKKGRPKGVPNKVSLEIKAFARAVTLDAPAYVSALRRRLRRGNASLEIELLHYGYGKPVDRIEEGQPGAFSTLKYAIRIPANKNLELAIEDVLFRSPGRPSRTPLVRYKSFHYQADSWTTARRVVAKVKHHVGELFPRVGFIVTNLPLPNRAVVRFYNKRGTAEQWIKEGKQAAHWTRLSCHRFRANEVRLQLSVLAYNLGNLWRRLVLPTRIDTWSLTSLQQRLVKTGGRLVKHARYYWLLLAESHLTRRLFGAMLGLMCGGRSGAGLTKNEHGRGEVSEKCPSTRSLPARATAR
jgi:Transposase DDE domain group 1